MLKHSIKHILKYTSMHKQRTTIVMKTNSYIQLKQYHYTTRERMPEKDTIPTSLLYTTLEREFIFL